MKAKDKVQRLYRVVTRKLNDRLITLNKPLIRALQSPDLRSIFGGYSKCNVYRDEPILKEELQIKFKAWIRDNDRAIS